MKRVATLMSMSWLVTAVRAGSLRPRTARWASVFTAVALVGTLLTIPFAGAATVSASEWASGSSPTADVGNGDEDDATDPGEPTIDRSETEDSPVEVPTSEPEPTQPPAPTPTPEPTPRLVLTGSADCIPGAGYAGLLNVVVAEAPATITDVLAVVTTGAVTPVRLTMPLPVTLAFDTARWQWWLDAPGGEASAIAPTALLVRVAELPGSDAANQIAGDGRNGWLLAEFTQPVAACALPTPTSKATATPAGDGNGGGGAGAGEESGETPDTATVTPEATPEPTETPAAESATATPEITPETDSAGAHPTPDPTETAAATASPETAGAAESEPIEINARSSDREVHPGEAARYRFRVTNTTDRPVTVRLVTTDSTEGWTSRVYEVDGITELAGRVKLDAGESIDVIVRVVPPAEVRPGEQNTTALDAVL
ncbi:MAG: hypothetical protein QOF73_2922 [Thermomicrobiales bacterium]|nr:hypothetical protein [Thermomicrobiales bacterium]